MSAALVVVVVGACIAVVASVMAGALEPGTRSPAHARGDQRKRRPPRATRRRTTVDPAETAVEPAAVPAARGLPVEPVRWWQRARAAALLGLLSTGLGVAMATAFGVSVLVLVALLRRSLG